MQVWRSEAGAIGRTEQQAVRRTQFDPAIIGELADIAPGKTKGVITARTVLSV